MLTLMGLDLGLPKLGCFNLHNVDLDWVTCVMPFVGCSQCLWCRLFSNDAEHLGENEDETFNFEQKFSCKLIDWYFSNMVISRRIKVMVLRRPSQKRRTFYVVYRWVRHSKAWNDLRATMWTYLSYDKSSSQQLMRAPQSDRIKPFQNQGIIIRLLVQIERNY